LRPSVIAPPPPHTHNLFFLYGGLLFFFFYGCISFRVSSGFFKPFLLFMYERLLLYAPCVCVEVARVEERESDYVYAISLFVFLP
jgi:hypothetical protein